MIKSYITSVYISKETYIFSISFNLSHDSTAPQLSRPKPDNLEDIRM